ncbi:MAG: exodeoxyribonuclease VII large subunit [Rikenellaceae bacterium]
MLEKQYISLRELQAMIKSSLERDFAFPLWVVAEISELKVNYNSGHCYMELIEKGGKNGVPSAKSSAVIWRSNYGVISSYFRSETGSELSVGMSVMLKVSVTFHELYGMSLQISDINPSFTLGDLARQRQKTINQLKKDGVYDMNKQLELPTLPQRIAVLSSKTAAGFQDFVKELDLSDYDIQVTLFEALMQGVQAEESIIEALDRIMASGEDFDAVVLIRGGGSQSDLSCFNSYELCACLAQYPLPIIAGIGHDKDESVADLVANISLKTPTAVAGFLIDSFAALDYNLDEYFGALSSSADKIINEKTTDLDKKIFALARVSDRFAQNFEMKIQSLENSLFTLSDRLLAENQLRLEKLEVEILGLRPEKILSLGFSIVKKDGLAVRSSEELKKGDKIEIIMSKGEISALVEK